ncbi:MAG: hypothetical protein ACKOB9_08590 [Solirubrobacterales bacterium]
MSTEPAEIIAKIAALQPAAAATAEGQISSAAVVGAKLGGGIAAPGEQRDQINELCRQIDVFKRLQADYSAGWKPEKEAPLAAPEVVAGATCVLLINAEPAATGSDADGWSLKCLNSALKAIEQNEQLPLRAELSEWAQKLFAAAVAQSAGRE